MLAITVRNTDRNIISIRVSCVKSAMTSDIYLAVYKYLYIEKKIKRLEDARPYHAFSIVAVSVKEQSNSHYTQDGKKDYQHGSHAGIDIRHGRIRQCVQSQRENDSCNEKRDTDTDDLSGHIAFGMDVICKILHFQITPW